MVGKKRDHNNRLLSYDLEIEKYCEWEPTNCHSSILIRTKANYNVCFLINLLGSNILQNAHLFYALASTTKSLLKVKPSLIRGRLNGKII